MYLGEVIRIYPNEETKVILNSYIDFQRSLFNKGLEIWNKMYSNYENTKDKKDRPSKYKVSKKLTIIKKEWEANIGKKFPAELINSSTNNLDDAWDRFIKRSSSGKPKFKSYKRAKRIVNLPRKNNSNIQIINKRYLKLTRTPLIRMSHSIRHNGTIQCCNITNEGDKWFASFKIKVDSLNFNQNSNGLYCGIDLGIKDFAIISGSDGYKKKYKSLSKKFKPLYKKIKFYRKLMDRKKNLNPKSYLKSKRYLKARTKLLNIWNKIKSIRKDYIEKITTNIINKYQYICIEELATKFLIKNPFLSKTIIENAWYVFKCRLIEKSELYGNTIIIADRFFPSTQICSNCGHRKKGKNKLSLKDRVYVCQKCNSLIDRDFNASLNLRNYAMHNIP